MYVRHLPLVLHTSNITVGGGILGIALTVLKSDIFITLRITFHCQALGFLMYMFYFSHKIHWKTNTPNHHLQKKKIQIEIGFKKWKYDVRYFSIYRIPLPIVVLCTFFFKHRSLCPTISYSTAYKRLCSWAGSGFATCGFISGSVDNMFHRFLFFCWWITWSLNKFWKLQHSQQGCQFYCFLKMNTYT